MRKSPEITIFIVLLLSVLLWVMVPSRTEKGIVAKGRVVSKVPGSSPVQEHDVISAGEISSDTEPRLSSASDDRKQAEQHVETAVLTGEQRKMIRQRVAEYRKERMERRREYIRARHEWRRALNEARREAKKTGNYEKYEVLKNAEPNKFQFDLK